MDFQSIVVEFKYDSYGIKKSRLRLQKGYVLNGLYQQKPYKTRSHAMGLKAGHNLYRL
jgi:hypothetical protein